LEGNGGGSWKIFFQFKNPSSFKQGVNTLKIYLRFFWDFLGFLGFLGFFGIFGIFLGFLGFFGLFMYF